MRSPDLVRRAPKTPGVRGVIRSSEAVTRGIDVLESEGDAARKRRRADTPHCFGGVRDVPTKPFAIRRIPLSTTQTNVKLRSRNIDVVSWSNSGGHSPWMTYRFSGQGNCPSRRHVHSFPSWRRRSRVLCTPRLPRDVHSGVRLTQ